MTTNYTLSLASAAIVSAGAANAINGGAIKFGYNPTDKSLTQCEGFIHTISDLTVGSAIVDVGTGGAIGRLVKDGPGQLTLTGANTYSGGTFVNVGTLEAMTPASLPNYGTSGKLSVTAGATLAVSTANWTSGNIDTLLANPSFLCGNLGLDVPAAASFGYGTAITTSGVGFVKLGGGTLTLSGANGYTGLTTVLGGALELGVNAQNPLLTLGGRADIPSGKLVFDYSGGSILSTIQSAVNSGGDLRAGRKSTVDLYRRSREQSDGREHVARRRQPRRHRRGCRSQHRPVELQPDRHDLVQGDFNGDGVVDGSDLNVVLSNYNQGVGLSAGIAVPEPATFVSLAIVAISLLGYAWRRRAS